MSSKKKGDAPAVVDDVAKIQEDIDSAFQETVGRAVAKVKTVETVDKPTMDVRHCVLFLVSPQLTFCGYRTRIKRSERGWSQHGCLAMRLLLSQSKL